MGYEADCRSGCAKQNSERPGIDSSPLIRLLWFDPPDALRSPYGCPQRTLQFPNTPCSVAIRSPYSDHVNGWRLD